MIPALTQLVEENARSGMLVAEIGVFRGESTLGYLPTLAACDGHVWLVDWFRGNPAAEGEHAYAPATHDRLKTACLQNLQAYSGLGSAAAGSG